uniref:Uncharacterized protein n=1 Tax=Ombrophytum subterraneum TaxID=50155 RepID=A0A6M8PYN1_9MAGN|nr:hypothetical protein [Ombrophytum subterraneum]
MNIGPDFNQQPDILYEQRIIIPDNHFINVELEQNEMASLINRLPKEELKNIIGEDSIRKPLNEFNAEQQARLRDIAINHFSVKNEIIAKMKSLYPNDEWDFSKLIRDTFFSGRQRDREYSLLFIEKMLSDLNKKEKRREVGSRASVEEAKPFNSPASGRFTCSLSCNYGARASHKESPLP